MEESWEEAVGAWAKAALCKKENYHGGNFEGNQCRQLLQHLNALEDNFGNAKIPTMTPYQVALKEFNIIRTSCFRADQPADPNYRDMFEKFKTSYVKLNLDDDLSVTPKLHELFFHVPEFIDKNPDLPVGLVAEQTPECLHNRWKKFSQDRMIKNRDNPNYKQSFFDCVVAFNGKQI